MTKLRIAIQKSGRLNQDSLEILKNCGVSIDNGKDQLKASARNFPMEEIFAIKQNSSHNASFEKLPHQASLNSLRLFTKTLVFINRDG